MSTAPTMQPGPTSFFETWISALTKPNESTYAAIAASPKAKATTGYLWVFLTSIVASLVTLVIQGANLRSQLSQSGVGTDQLGGAIGSVAVTLICVTPIAAVIGTLFFAIVVAIVQWVARMFGGKGTNDQLAYTMAAISAPYSLISSVFVLLSAIPYVGFCFRIVLGLMAIYVIVLQITAVKAVNQFGWGPAIGSLLIPGLVILFVLCCAFVVVGSLAGLAFGNVLSTINQSLFP